MIALNDVTLFRPGTRRRELILRNVTLNFPRNVRVGILAAQGTGKSTIARLLSGIEKPDYGVVSHVGQVSWPLGFAGFMHPFLSVSENLHFIAQLCGLAPDHMVAFCQTFIGARFEPHKMVQDLAPAERMALSYACSVAKEWDHYIVDETISVGDTQMRARCDALLARRQRDAGLVIVSRNVQTLKNNADLHFVLINAELKPCPDLDAGFKALELNPVDPSRRSLEHTIAEGP